MIQRAPSYITSDGRSFAELKDAQQQEIELCLFGGTERTTSDTETRIIQSLLDKKDQIIDILTTKPNSKLKARKINGGTKKRKAVEVAV